MIYDIVLNLEKSGIKPRVKVSQYDKTLPQIRASLFCNNQAFNIPSGSTVFIMGTKKDNTGFEYECTYENNVVTATITDQMTVFAGDVECEFTINTSDSRKGTENFILEVEPCALSDDVQISETDIPIIQHITDYIAEANEYAELSHNWANYGDNSAEPTADNNSKHWSDVSHDWANYDDDSTSPSATNNAKYWSDVAESKSEVAHNWANYGDDSTAPSATNNAKYWSDMAQQYAQGGLVFKGSILFANLPTTGMSVGDMYNMEDNFTTDSRFQEGSGISVKAGTNIAWNTNNKWDLLATGGGSDDYTELTNKPQINGVTLSGNKTSADLGISGGGSNRNLLDNAWFTVNQKGFTSTSTSGSILDRWKMNFGSVAGTVTKVSNGLELSPTDPTWISIYQKIENISDIVGKCVTASFMLANGTIYSGSGIVPSSDNFYFNISGVAEVYISNSNSHFMLATYNNITIRAVKLELGSESTLHLDIAPDYTTELLKCQRYYHKYRTQSLRPTYKEDCVPEMRIHPTHETITIDGVTYYVNNAEL